MSRLLLAIMSRADEQKALTILGAVVSVVGVYMGFGVKGAGIEVAIFAVIALVIARSRKAQENDDSDS